MILHFVGLILYQLTFHWWSGLITCLWHWTLACENILIIFLFILHSLMQTLKKVWENLKVHVLNVNPPLPPPPKPLRSALARFFSIEKIKSLNSLVNTLLQLRSSQTFEFSQTVSQVFASGYVCKQVLHFLFLKFITVNRWEHFLLYNQGYKPPDEGPSEYQTIPLNKIEDFGVHCKQ